MRHLDFHHPGRAKLSKIKQLNKELDILTQSVYILPMSQLPYSKGSILFAPMEGVTDEPYRLAMHRAFPEWDYWFTDFLRVPTEGHYNEKKIREHYGESIFKDETLRKKTGYQILTTARANTEDTVKKIAAQDIHHLDLNLGCPSKKVNAHKGGAYLLSDFEALKKILKIIRKNFQKTFTVKIRIGYHDTSLFEDSIKLFEDEGAEAITIHGRTRDERYKGKANWDYIKRAVEISSLPIIGNGDIWLPEDVNSMFEHTGCYGVMLGRGALKTPWLAQVYQENKDNLSFLNEDFLLMERKKYLEIYFEELETEYAKVGWDQGHILKRFKAFSRNLFDDYEDYETVRGHFLRSRELNEFKDHLYNSLQ